MAAHNPNKGPPKFEEVFNKDHASDVKYALQQTRWILKMSGMWPRSNPTRCQRYISNLALPICPIAAIIILVPVVSYAVLGDSKILTVFGMIAHKTGALLKSLLLIFHRDAIRVFVQHIEANWRRVESSYDREIMMRNLKTGRDVTTLCVVWLCASSLYFIFVPYFMPPYLNALNQSVRPLLYPGFDNFVDTQSDYNYEIVYFVSFVCAMCSVFVYIAIYNIALTFVTHACGQMQIIISRLETLGAYAEDIVNTEHRIEFIIRTHVRVLRFSSNIEKLLREICLVEVFVNTVLMCWVEYWFLTELENRNISGVIRYFILFISYSWNLFIFCHVGELLKDECEKVGRAAYMIEWYKLPGKTGLALILMMTMAKYPRKLTAGRVIELTYLSFGSMIKTNMAYMNMMRTLTL